MQDSNIQNLIHQDGMKFNVRSPLSEFAGMVQMFLTAEFFYKMQAHCRVPYSKLASIDQRRMEFPHFT